MAGSGQDSSQSALWLIQHEGTWFLLNSESSEERSVAFYLPIGFPVPFNVKKQMNKMIRNIQKKNAYQIKNLLYDWIFCHLLFRSASSSCYVFCSRQRGCSPLCKSNFYNISLESIFAKKNPRMSAATWFQLTNN